MDVTSHEPSDPDNEEPGGVAPRGGKRPLFPNSDSIARAIEAGQIGVWSWDLVSNEIAWSPNLESVHGLPHGSFDGTFTFFEKDVHPDDLKVVKAAVQRALQTRQPYMVEYRLSPRADGSERWISARGMVIVDNSKPVRLLGVCQDVTERVNTELQLRARVNQQALVARLGEQALLRSDLPTLLNEIARAVATILEVEYVKILELLPGDIELLLRAGAGWEAGLIGTARESTGLDSQAGFTLVSNAPVIVEDTATETRFTVAPLLRQHGVVSGITVKISGPDGRSYGVIGVHTTRRRKFNAHDVSFIISVANIIAGAIQRNQSEQRNEMMIRELRHRSGNLFSQLLALFTQTASSSRSMADLSAKYEARLLALASAHRLIAEGGWRPTSLDDLLRAQLAPDVEHVALEGAGVFLDPDVAFPFSTVIHELAANARQHGSLSAPAGRIGITWSIDRTEKGVTLFLDWQEQHGPTPKKRPRPRFGSRLIDTVIERQLNGELQRWFGEPGFRVRMAVPLTRERWPSQKADNESVNG